MTDKPKLNLIELIDCVREDDCIYIERDKANRIIQKWHDKEFEVGYCSIYLSLPHNVDCLKLEGHTRSIIYKTEPLVEGRRECDHMISLGLARAMANAPEACDLNYCPKCGDKLP